LLQGDNNVIVDSSLTQIRIGTYADLEPKTAGPLYVSGKFNADNQYVLFLHASEDHNGAFLFNSMKCKRLNCWAQRGFEVVLRRVATKEAAKGVLDEFNDDSIHHVVISGHGAPNMLQWGPSSSGWLMPNDRATESVLLKLRKKIKIDGTVTLDACSTAGENILGMQNLFEYVSSKLPGRQVTAAQVPTTPDMWRRVQETGNLREARDVEEDADPNVDEQCIAGDRVQLLSRLDLHGVDGKDVTSIRWGGRPNCKELTKDQISLFDECLSRCRKSCDSVWEDWNTDDRKNTNVHLDADLPATEDIVKKDLNPCYFGKKTVCKILSPKQKANVPSADGR